MTPDLTLLRRTLALATAARERGDHPFGALLAGPDGAILAEALNSVETGRDVTGHAESNLVRAAWRDLGPAALADATLYTSCEPCAMCAGAIYWAGIPRVVYALGEEGLRELTGDGPGIPTLAHPCRRVFADGNRPVEVHGPLLDAEAAEPHRGFWH